MAKQQKYYAIKVGKGVKDKIVTSWSECEALVKGYPSVYKSFKTEEEALEYLGAIKDVKRNYKRIRKLWSITRLRRKAQYL